MLTRCFVSFLSSYSKALLGHTSSSCILTSFESPVVLVSRSLQMFASIRLTFLLEPRCSYSPFSKNYRFSFSTASLNALDLNEASLSWNPLLCKFHIMKSFYSLIFFAFSNTLAIFMRYLRKASNLFERSRCRVSISRPLPFLSMVSFTSLQNSQICKYSKSLQLSLSCFTLMFLIKVCSLIDSRLKKSCLYSSLQWDAI
jgi:hypothetical protein